MMAPLATKMHAIRTGAVGAAVVAANTPGSFMDSSSGSARPVPTPRRTERRLSLLRMERLMLCSLIERQDFGEGVTFRRPDQA
jgi:hypothetical protein